MKIMNSFANSLMKRREVVLALEHASNPGFAHAATVVAEHFKIGEDHVVVRAIRNNYGSKTFLIEAFVYDSPDAKLLVEPKVKAKKGAAA